MEPFLRRVPMKIPMNVLMKLSTSTLSMDARVLLARAPFVIAIIVLTLAPAIAQGSFNSSTSSSSNSSSAPGSFGSSIPGSSASVSPFNSFQNGGFSGNVNALQASNYVIGGGYRYGLNGAFLNQYGQQVFLNPLVPYVWPASRPQFTGGAAFTCRIGNFNCNFWKGSSGYYYPFLSNTFLYAPIIFVDSVNSTPLAKLPPPAIQLTDTLKYLDDSSKDKKVAESHYKHLKQRATDLQRKERSMRIAQGGELDAESEAEIRRDLDGLAKEMSAHVKDR